LAGIIPRFIDLNQALVYLSFAVIQGDLIADQTLGYWHYAGIGMPKSCQKSFWHYQRVADHGQSS
jgi:TPR repeat protein